MFSLLFLLFWITFNFEIDLVLSRQIDPWIWNVILPDLWQIGSCSETNFKTNPRMEVLWLADNLRNI